MEANKEIKKKNELAALEAAIEATTGTGSQKCHQLFVGEIQKLIEVNTTKLELTEDTALLLKRKSATISISRIEELTNVSLIDIFVVRHVGLCNTEDADDEGRPASRKDLSSLSGQGSFFVAPHQNQPPCSAFPLSLS